MYYSIVYQHFSLLGKHKVPLGGYLISGIFGREHKLLNVLVFAFFYLFCVKNIFFTNDNQMKKAQTTA